MKMLQAILAERLLLRLLVRWTVDNLYSKGIHSATLMLFLLILSSYAFLATILFFSCLGARHMWRFKSFSSTYHPRVLYVLFFILMFLFLPAVASQACSMPSLSQSLKADARKYQTPVLDPAATQPPRSHGSRPYPYPSYSFASTYSRSCNHPARQEATKDSPCSTPNIGGELYHCGWEC
jgi:hypothetical protein